MALTSRRQLIDYCLRRLGAPVIRIDVAEEQLNDRVDDALQMFSEYHFNGTQRSYYRHQITTQDITNQYITLPDNVIGVVEIFPLQGFTVTGGDIFNVRYQIAMNDLYTLAGTNLVPYYMSLSHLNLINELLVGRIPIRYNRRNGNRLYIDTDYKELRAGLWCVVECHQVVNPTEFAGVYDEIWLKQYLTALIKHQWGSNLSKFTGQPLVGGITFNGPQIVQEANQEIQQAMEDLERKYVLPPLDRMA